MAPSNDPKYARAQSPINLRTAERKRSPSRPLSAKVDQRVKQALAKQVLGVPLSRQLGQSASTNKVGPRQSMRQHALLGIAPMLALAGIWLIWKEFGLLATIGGDALLAVGLGAIALAVRARMRTMRTADADCVAPVFDPQSLFQLDQVLEQIAPCLPPSSVENLITLKNTLVRISPMLRLNPVNETFTIEDRLYITECVRRYLPDTLQAYLQVPVHLRTTSALEGGESAQALLDGQLRMFQTELARREVYLNQGAGQLLQRQQRFLQAKHGATDLRDSS